MMFVRLISKYSMNRIPEDRMRFKNDLPNRGNIWYLKYGLLLAILVILFIGFVSVSSVKGIAQTATLSSVTGTPICGTPISVSGVISADTTWTTANLYIVDGDITVSTGNTLTIQPGVVVKFKFNTGIYVDGKLTAEGTATNPVYFTAWKDDTLCGDTNNDGTDSVPNTGDWEWIEFIEGSDPTSSISRTVVRYGGRHKFSVSGQQWRAPIRIFSVTPSFEHITFEHNFRNAVEIIGGNWDDATLDDPTIIYWLYGDLTIPSAKTWVLTPGVKVKIADNSGIYVDGKFIADGTEIEPIYFTDDDDDMLCGQGAAGENICDTNNNGTDSVPEMGSWEWIEFREGSEPTSSISRAVVRYGGRHKFSVSGQQWRAPIRIFSITPSFEHITFEDNYRNAVEVIGGSWDDATLDDPTIIYWLRGNLTVPAAKTLTLTPGAKFKVDYNSGIYVDGKFVADGTETDPIYFTDNDDDTLCGQGAAGEDICDTNNNGTDSVPGTGNWDWIEFREESDPTSSISRTVIRFGGGNRAPIRIANVTPSFTNITFTENNRNAVELIAGNWRNTTLASTGVIYWLNGDLTVLAGNTMNIDPGTKIKMAGSGDILIKGKLVASGSADIPIYFTSERDDGICAPGFGGDNICDTNNDGTDTVPASGNWGYLQFNADSDESSLLNYAYVRYGAGVRLEGVSPFITNSALTFNSIGLTVRSDATPTLTCNDIFSNESYGIHNDTPDTVVTAENQWWGNVSGPTHPSNPNGIGDKVTDGIDFTPWATNTCVTVLPPEANFSARVTHGPPPFTVEFMNLSTGNYTTSLWDFGDGTTSNEENPTHTYANIGTYTVSLTVTGTDANDTMTKEDYISVKYYSYLPMVLKP